MVKHINRLRRGEMFCGIAHHSGSLLRLTWRDADVTGKFRVPLRVHFHRLS
jgi:hypothetical protein